MYYYFSAKTAGPTASPETAAANANESDICAELSPPEEPPMDDVLRQAETLLRFSGEMENRLAESGLQGVDGVIERYLELRNAIDGLSQRELDWAKAEVDRLIATLHAVAAQLEKLQAIKRKLGDPD
jgi:hypothetical protein